MCLGADGVRYHMESLNKVLSLFAVRHLEELSRGINDDTMFRRVLRGASGRTRRNGDCHVYVQQPERTLHLEMHN